MTRHQSLPDLVTDLSLPYRLYPANGTPQGLILLLHGVGSNETSLAGLVPHLPDGHSIALVRSPYPMGPNAFRAFAVNFTPQGPSIDKAEAEASRQTLIRFVGELQQRTGVTPEHTLIAGFSQGGIMSAGLALTQPELVAGFAILSGRILPEIEALIPAQEKLRHLKALILHGETDGTLPVTWADRSAELLNAHLVKFKLKKFPANHEITVEMIKELSEWLKQTTILTISCAPHNNKENKYHRHSNDRTTHLNTPRPHPIQRPPSCMKINFNDVLIEENQYINKRREYSLIHEPGETYTHPHWGLALSGGGVRSAFFCIGALKSLIDLKQMRRFDYVSAVSGGGYSAAALVHQIANRGREKPFSTHGGAISPQSPDHKIWLMLLKSLATGLVSYLPIILYTLLILNTISESNNTIKTIVWATILTLTIKTIFTKETTIKNRIKNSSKIASRTFVAIITIYIYTTSIIISSITTTAILFAITKYTEIYHHRKEKLATLTTSIALTTMLLLISCYINNLIHSLFTQNQTTAILFTFLTLSLITLRITTNQVNSKLSAGVLYEESLRDTFLPTYFKKYPTLLHEALGSWSPLLILNTSITSNEKLKPFELSPIFSGNQEHNYYKTSEAFPKLTLARAMAISGAAIEYTKTRSPFYRALQSILFPGLGYWWSPPEHTANKQSPSIAHIFETINQTGKIPRLSDGGFVDNLGLLPLVKRRVNFILCIDASYDPEFNFDDLINSIKLIAAETKYRISINNITEIQSKLRFAQPDIAPLQGTIHYGEFDAPDDIGHLLVIKLHTPTDLHITFNQSGKIHFPTEDQNLTEDELKELEETGNYLIKKYFQYIQVI